MTSAPIKKQRCRKCDQLDQEYYANRKTCIKCTIGTVKKYQEKNLGSEAVSIKCKGCEIVQTPDNFSISEKTGLHKTKCFGCRRNGGMPVNIPPHVNKDRYKVIADWLMTLSATSSKEDMYIVKHFLSNHFIY